MTFIQPAVSIPLGQGADYACRGSRSRSRPRAEPTRQQLSLPHSSRWVGCLGFAVAIRARRNGRQSLKGSTQAPTPALRRPRSPTFNSCRTCTRDPKLETLRPARLGLRHKGRDASRLAVRALRRRDPVRPRLPARRRSTRESGLLAPYLARRRQGQTRLETETGGRDVARWKEGGAVGKSRREDPRRQRRSRAATNATAEGECDLCHACQVRHHLLLFGNIN